MRLAHPAGDQPGVLRPEVDDEDGVGHRAEPIGLNAPSPRPGSAELLALGLQRRGDHDLGLLELLDRLVAAGRHRGAQRAEEVHAAVVLVGRAEQDLAQRAAHRGAHPGAARQRRVEGGHAPVEAAGRRLEGGRQRRAEHDGVGAAGDGLGDVAALGHAAVGDDVHVDAGLVQVAHAGPGHVRDGGRLGYAEPEHAPGRAGVARADADQHADRAGAHEVQRRPGTTRSRPR